MIALLPTGGKLCHQPQVMSLYPLALLQGYTQKSVLFCCCLFCRASHMESKTFSCTLKKLLQLP